MTRLRSILFWCHLSGGVGAGLVIFVMCATGAILSMKPQVLSLVDRQVRFVDARNTPRLPPSQIIAAVTAREPGAQPMSFSENRDPGAAAAVGLAGNDTVYVDPYNAAVLGHGSTRAQAFFRSAEDWHRWLAVSGDNRATARWATDAATLVFCALA
ncbi:MAG TPA: PepSY domain-containing protein, partial [Vicinamibacterales bacterium]|nr:PepSY domain-containing protein [Vicinamibacterales bacterium]